MNKNDDFEKVVKVIESCVTGGQIIIAYNMACNWFLMRKVYKTNRTPEEVMEDIASFDVLSYKCLEKARSLYYLTGIREGCWSDV